MRIDWKKLLICIAIPLAVGGLSALFTAGNMKLFEEINKPPLSPPGWLFPVVWTILYVLMGIALYLVAVAKTRENKAPAYISFGVLCSVILKPNRNILEIVRITSSITLILSLFFLSIKTTILL